MGYCSEVAIVIEFATSNQAQTYLVQSRETYPTLKEWDAETLQVKGKYIVFYAPDIKWYEFYQYIKDVKEFYHNSEFADGWISYIFKRLGEDPEDYEEDMLEYKDGETAVWDHIDYIRSLEINVPFT